MPTIPDGIDPLPTPVPSSEDPSNFDPRADAFLAALPAMATQMSAAADATYQNALDAEAAAEEAAAAAQVAGGAVGVALWDPATSYAAFQAAISPTDSQSYRRLAPGGVDATDPALSANWAVLGGVTLVGGSMTAAARMPAGSIAQRPASPAVGHTRINAEAGPGLRFVEYFDGAQWVPVGRTNAVAIPVTGGSDFIVDPVPDHVKRVELMIYDFASPDSASLNLYVSDDGEPTSGYLTRNRIRGVRSEMLASSNVAAGQDLATSSEGGVIVLLPGGISGAGILGGKVTLTRTADPSEWVYEFVLARTGTVRHIVGTGRFEITGTGRLGRIRLLNSGSAAPGRTEVIYEF